MAAEVGGWVRLDGGKHGANDACRQALLRGCQRATTMKDGQVEHACNRRFAFGSSTAPHARVCIARSPPPGRWSPLPLWLLDAWHSVGGTLSREIGPSLRWFGCGMSRERGSDWLCVAGRTWPHGWKRGKKRPRAGTRATPSPIALSLFLVVLLVARPLPIPSRNLEHGLSRPARVLLPQDNGALASALAAQDTQVGDGMSLPNRPLGLLLQRTTHLQHPSAPSPMD